MTTALAPNGFVTLTFKPKTKEQAHADGVALIASWRVRWIRASDPEYARCNWYSKWNGWHMIEQGWADRETGEPMCKVWEEQT